jgi:hypothetical protein
MSGEDGRAVLTHQRSVSGAHTPRHSTGTPQQPTAAGVPVGMSVMSCLLTAWKLKDAVANACSCDAYRKSKAA